GLGRVTSGADSPPRGDRWSPIRRAKFHVPSDKTRRSGNGKSTTSPTTDGPSVSAIRQWARDQGYSVGERGRVPSEIVDAYLDAHPVSAAPPTVGPTTTARRREQSLPELTGAD